MKKIIIVLVTLLMVTFSSVAQTPLVYDERIIRNGEMYIRVVNVSAYTVGCSLEDDFNFHTFYVYPATVGMWYKVYGHFQWHCE